MKINFDNTYSQLPSAFYTRIESPNDFNPTLIAFNESLAQELGIDRSAVGDSELARIFSASEFPAGSEPMAMVYAGHQFGHFVPRLGDGRALLLGEVLSRQNKRFDIHLKGSGRTLYSRGGDGLSAIGPVLREYIVSEAMHALHIPTTRSLCAVRTGQTVYRNKEVPGAVLTRVASTHLRVGTFEYFARQPELANLKILADFAIDRIDPDLSESSQKYFDFWKRVALRQSELISLWMGVGFIHGVMNTDNTSLAGETIDFGPCAFMDEFVLSKVFSSIDRQGRYAYANQPSIGLWNLARLAECLIPLMDYPDEGPEKFIQELQSLQKVFAQQFLSVMMRKFGLRNDVPGDQELLESWFGLLEKNNVDFTLAYIDLERILEKKKPLQGLDQVPGFDEFLRKLEERYSSASVSREEVLELMKKTNPTLIPRNHQIEKAIESAEKGSDEAFRNLFQAVQKPFIRVDSLGEYHLPPKPEERVTQTFCGT